MKTRVAIVLGLCASALWAQPLELWVSGGDGVREAELDPESGRISIGEVRFDQGAGWFAVSPSGGEMAVISGGELLVLSGIDGDEWRVAARSETFGGTPCFVEFGPGAETVWVANFRKDTRPSRGSLVEFAWGGGELERTRRLEHEGSGAKSPRQDNSHPHCVVVGPKGEWLAVGDLGIDRLVLYRLDEAGRIRPDSRVDVEVGPATAPRHVAFHPSGEWVFVNTEMSSEVVAVRLGEEPELVSRCSSRPLDQAAGGAPSDLVIHPGGKFLYSANRGSDTIAVVRFEEGELELVETVGKGGRNARSLAISGDGAWLVAANQSSDALVSFRVDPESGRLTRVPGVAAVRAPACVGFGG